MTLAQVRQFALSLPEVTEEPHFERTSFRVGGKIFATAPPDGETANIFLGELPRDAALSQAPDFLRELSWGKQIVGLCVTLAGAKPAVVHELLAQAWSSKAPRRLLAGQAVAGKGTPTR